jgi:hypothetical protein
MTQAMGAVGLGTTMAGGVLSAYGAEKGGQAQQQMYNYQAAVAKINTQIDLQNRDYALNVGGEQSVIEGLKGGQQAGAIRAAQGASGIDVSSGSAADVQRSQRTVTAMDLTQIRSNAAKTAYDFDVKSVMDTNQASLDVMAGQNAKLAGDIGAVSSILGSVSSVSSKWMQGKQAGMFT